MWINFESTRPFAIKIFAGGVNVVSGEPAVDTLANQLKRIKLVEDGESIQDYVVSGYQEWLDGIATGDGQVMQFVATNVGSGYSVEAQVTGHDSIAGIQFEIMPTRRKGISIYVRNLTGRLLAIETEASATVYDIKRKIEEMDKVLADDQRLIYAGKQLEDRQYSSLGLLYIMLTSLEKDSWPNMASKQ